MKEIYKVKFNKYLTAEGVPSGTMYTLDCPGWVDGEMLTPQKITIKDERVIVEFKELGIRHEFAFTPDVEIFRRDKHAKEIQTGDNQEGA
jgi:hypothetical protein